MDTSPGTFQPDWNIIDPITYQAILDSGYAPSFVRELLEVGVDLSAALKVLSPAARQGVNITSVHIEVLSKLGALDGAAMLLRAGAVNIGDLLWLATKPAEDLRAARDLLVAGFNPTQLHGLQERMGGFQTAGDLSYMGTPAETISGCKDAQNAQVLLDAVNELYDSADVTRAARARQHLSGLGVTNC